MLYISYLSCLNSIPSGFYFVQSKFPLISVSESLISVSLLNWSISKAIGSGLVPLFSGNLLLWSAIESLICGCWLLFSGNFALGSVSKLVENGC